MERLWSTPRSVLGALVLLLALNVLSWAIIAYSGGRHAGEKQTWSHERARLVDQQALFKERLEKAEEELIAHAKTAAAAKQDLAQQTAAITDLKSRLDAQKTASEDLEHLRTRLASEAQHGAAARTALAEELAAYKDRINLARSELSGKTATLAAREREIAKADGQLSDRQAKLEKGDWRLEALSEEISQSESELAELTQAIEGKRIKIEQQRSAIAESRKASLLASSKRLAAANATLKQAGRTLAAKRKEASRLDQDIRSGEERLAEIKGQAEAYESRTEKAKLLIAQADQAEAQRAALESEIGKANETKREKSKRLAAVLSTLSEARSELDAVRASKEELDAEVTDLKEAALARETALSAARQETEAAEARKAKAEKDLAALKAKMTSIESGLEMRLGEQAKMLEEQNQAEASLDVVRTELEKGRAALERTRKGNANAARKAQALEEALAALAADIDRTLEEKEVADIELQSLHLDVERAKVDLAARESVLLESRAVLAGLVKEREQVLKDIERERSEVVSSSTASGIDPLLGVLPVKTDSGVRIAHLLFNYSSAELSPGAKRKIEGATTWIQRNQVQKVRLIGYADASGSSAANKTLSRARAAETAKALADLGIDPANIEIEAVGEDVLVEATGNRVAEPLNRSVGIFIGE